MAKRVFLIVLDSFGIGEEPDADLFGDIGTNTIKSCSQSRYFELNNLKELGLFNIDGVKDWAQGVDHPKAAFARLRESSMGKDTTIGHWEIAGVISKEPLPVFPEGFPKEILDKITEITGRQILCNLPYSGTKVINDYGDEHIKTGALIVYTSADSVLQIAAHESVVPVEELYDYCRKVRTIMSGSFGVGRIIARPFEGSSGAYVRTPRRHDFSLVPPSKTMLNCLKDNGFEVLSVGKINDIFAGSGITDYVYTTDNEDGINKTLDYLNRDFNGLCFTNLVDFDMKYGHRRDVDGYAKALTYFDKRLPEIIDKMQKDDVLMITADHGCDPAYTKTTDHTREYIPLIMYGKEIEASDYGTRQSFADIGATVLKLLGTQGDISGTSFV